jgi:hypothetical protein
MEFYNEDDINTILTQTNYTREEAITKLALFNNNPICVIKNYMGIPLKKEEPKKKTLNQEIFRQIRTKLDTSMREYREKNPTDINKVIENLQESEKREKLKIK